MLIVLPIALLLVLVWIGWNSRRTPYVTGTCCGTQQWPPTDLVDGVAAEPAPEIRVRVP